MDALLYEESPLADILEGDAIPFEKPQSIPSSPEQYAPHGLPKLRDQLRFIRQKARLVTDASEERFLERFRYTIIASQLLSEDNAPRRRNAEDQSNPPISFSLKGAYLIAAFSFSFAWLLSWMRTRWNSTTATDWAEVCLFVTVAATLAIAVAHTARRQYLKFVRQSAIVAASRLVSEAQDLDSSTSAALRYIQEIEVVAKGYEISHPLPPVTRLDEKQGDRQCKELRSAIAKSLVAGIGQFVHFHNQLQALVDPGDLDTYYRIYELSSENFAETVTYANESSAGVQESLRQLRFLSGIHNIARRFFLADLLAIRAKPSWSDVPRWRKVVQIVQTIVEDNVQASLSLQDALHHEEDVTYETSANGTPHDDFVASPVAGTCMTPEKQHSQAQMRRLETLVHGVRSLNAKAKIARDEVTGLIALDAGEGTLSANFARHYDMLGSDLRGLLVEWERGRNTMLLGADPTTRFSHPSSGPRSPISPSPSLGGLTMVDGGPAEALRVLNGDDYASGAETGGHDEEIFEAVAKPRKRMSLAFSRDEKIAKLQEDRRKRATLQEHADTTTNMLRELQMVIKHRPTPSKPNNRVTLL